MALRLRGATSGYIELKAPASAGDNTLTLPTNNGSANQLLKTDGSGNLSWTDDNSGVSLSGSTNNTIATVTGANALVGEANLTFDGNNLAMSGTGVFTITRNSRTLTLEGNYGNEGHPAVKTSTGHDLRIFTNGNNEKVRITSDGDVGIGTTGPNGKLHICEVSTETGGDINANADGLIVDNSGGNTGLTFKTPNTASSRVCFGDPEDNNVGQILYNHSTDDLTITAADNIIFEVDNVGIGTSSPKGTLDIQTCGSDGVPTIAFGGNNSSSTGTTRTDGTDKAVRVGCVHQTNAEQPFAIFYAVAGASSHNTINYGGGTSWMNAATRHQFHTAANTTTTSGTNKMTIHQGGDVEIIDGNLKLASGKGVMFHPHDESVSTPGSDSNLLDDYEEGTFTLSFGTSGTNFSTDPTLSQNNCRYTKIGNTVTISAYVGWGTQGAGGSGDLRIAGLPFTQNSAAVYNGAYFGWYSFSGGFDADTILQAYVSNGSTYLTLLKTTTGDTSPTYATVPHSAVVGLSGTYQLSMTYSV